MSPLELSIMASVFLVVLMTALTFMFFFSTTWDRKDEETSESADISALISEMYLNSQEITSQTGISAEELGRKSVSAYERGNLLESVYLNTAKNLMENKFPERPDNLREVLLPDVTRINKYLSYSIFHQNIAHSGIKNHLTVLFNITSGPLLDHYSENPGNFNLKPEHLARNHRKLEVVTGYISLISRVFLRFEPEIYYLPDGEMLSIASTRKNSKWFPSIVIGKSFLKLTENQMIFMLAQKIALLRPELRFVTLFSSEKEFTEFSVSFSNGITKSPLIEKFIEISSETSRDNFTRITDNVDTITSEEITEWKNGVVYSAIRLAFIFMSRWYDVDQVMQLQKTPEFTHELVKWMISPEFFATLRFLDIIPD
ncbi:MAG: hypothetical protein JXR95_06080 [Deltaproteobacteria bacterium]|nr:hypothetical protein [Deltaproteobacteria bacterium]